MLNNKKKIGLVLIGAEFIIGSVVAIYSYGQCKFYEGRISASKELTDELNKLKTELEKHESK